MPKRCTEAEAGCQGGVPRLRRGTKEGDEEECQGGVLRWLSLRLAERDHKI